MGSACVLGRNDNIHLHIAHEDNVCVTVYTCQYCYSLHVCIYNTYPYVQDIPSCQFNTKSVIVDLCEYYIIHNA